MAPLDPLPPLLGGALMGLGAGALIAVSGRCGGVSGILDGAMRADAPPWRWTFLAGLVAGGVLLKVLAPETMPGLHGSVPLLASAGLLVGFGTRVSGGCTSGHGIVGNSRLSPRSVVATMVFMGAGFATLAVQGVLGD